MPVSKERLNEIAAIPDDRIDTPDIPEMNESFFATAKPVMPPLFPLDRHFDRSAEGA